MTFSYGFECGAGGGGGEGMGGQKFLIIPQGLKSQKLLGFWGFSSFFVVFLFFNGYKVLVNVTI